MITRTVLIAGGNLGDVEKALEEARRKVEERIGCVVMASGIYESDAWGFEAEERFRNQVWVVDTPLSPLVLLDEIEKIERESGREHKGGEVYRSRTMDIDILFYGEKTLDLPRLTVPHPLLHRRRFVLEPLCEVLPEWVHPILGRTVKELLEECEER